jgi:hypothetical protein
MRNVKDLRDELISTFEKLRDGLIGIREAKEVANVAGKILSSAKIQLEYNVYTKSKRRVKFLESDE